MVVTHGYDQAALATTSCSMHRHPSCKVQYTAVPTSMYVRPKPPNLALPAALQAIAKCLFHVLLLSLLCGRCSCSAWTPEWRLQAGSQLGSAQTHTAAVGINIIVSNVVYDHHRSPLSTTPSRMHSGLQASGQLLLWHMAYCMLHHDGGDLCGGCVPCPCLLLPQLHFERLPQACCVSLTAGLPSCAQYLIYSIELDML